MPTYIRPKVAYIDPGGRDVGGLVLALGGVLAIGAVVAFVLAHLVLLAAAAAVFATVMGALAWWTRWLASPERLQEHRATVPAAKPAQAITAPPARAIEAPAHHRARPQPAEQVPVQVRRLR